MHFDIESIQKFVKGLQISRHFPSPSLLTSPVPPLLRSSAPPLLRSSAPPLLLSLPFLTSSNVLRTAAIKNKQPKILIFLLQNGDQFLWKKIDKAGASVVHYAAGKRGEIKGGRREEGRGKREEGRGKREDVY